MQTLTARPNETPDRLRRDPAAGITAMRLHPLLALLAVLGSALVGCGTEPARSAAASPRAAQSEPAPSATAEASEDTGPPADAARLDDGDTIILSQNAFGQEAAIVPAGATLTFTNEDVVTHTVTHDVPDPLFDETVRFEASVEITFSETGRVDIICVPHHGMDMTVFVEG